MKYSYIPCNEQSENESEVEIDEKKSNETNNSHKSNKFRVHSAIQRTKSLTKLQHQTTVNPF